MNNNIFKKTLIASALSFSVLPLVCAAEMVGLSDEEMSSDVGQALLSMAYTAPSGAGTGANTTDYGYYKVGLEAKMELNVNIRRLQLGCGGRNGPGNCDLDFENLSLSGPADGKVVSGVIADNGAPTWSVAVERANTSALITNPFVEFAIKNPGIAAQREVIGFRLSAEDILGHMSAGTINDKNGSDVSTGGGIHSFSGYIRVGVTPVKSTTTPAIFGTTEDQAIAANIETAVGSRTAQANVNLMTPGRTGYTAAPSSGSGSDDVYKYDPDGAGPAPATAIWGINVPSQSVSFNFPQTAVTGNRMSQLNLVVRDVPIGSTIPGQPDTKGRIAIGRNSGAVSMILSSPIIWAEKSTFFMGAEGTGTGPTNVGSVAYCEASYQAANCSYLAGLKANATVKQNFNLVHNLPITSGGYLSLQKEALRWPDSASAFTYDPATATYTDVSDSAIQSAPDTVVKNYGDIAQPGWWMSFKDPLDFGELNPTTQIPMEDVLPQLATYITDYLSRNTIHLPFNSALGALFGVPVYYGLGDIVLAEDARAVMVLQNLLLDGNQKPIANCWGRLKFC